MTLQRADRLKEPPVVGRFYLVPAIFWQWGSWNGSFRWWPVMGRKHDDIAHFNFPHLHYHVDARFMTRRLWAEVNPSVWNTKLQQVQARPLNSAYMRNGPERPILRRMKCTAAAIPWQHSDVPSLRDAFAGQQCGHGKRGWVCPHRQFSLGSIPPVDGVIMCPLHGLRIDAQTGICLGKALAA